MHRDLIIQMRLLGINTTMQPDIPLATTETTPPAGSAASTETVYASPGVTTNRKIGTGVFLALLAAFTIFVAAEQGANVLISTIIGFLFIAGFIGYLKIV